VVAVSPAPMDSNGTGATAEEAPPTDETNGTPKPEQ
jgi:hypothetical protein